MTKKNPPPRANATKKIPRRTLLAGAGLVPAGSLILSNCRTSGQSQSLQTKQQGESDNIVSAAIYPPIGIMRVGNSNETGNSYFIGPERTGTSSYPAGFYHDSSGELKKQAARFRIYGLNAEGEFVKELTADNAEITWTVQLANKKASWYRILVAADLEEVASMEFPRRNKNVPFPERNTLNIMGGTRTISGRNQTGETYVFNEGKFSNVHVPLGSLESDDKGRLIVIPASGVSASPENKPVMDENDWDTFNNADGWYDDIADGPVTASIKINGQEIPVKPAWVVGSPPNYGSDIIGWRTLYDLLEDLYIEKGWLPMPSTKFRRHILPILTRLQNLRWVNKGFDEKFGFGREFDFDDTNMLRELARNGDAGASMQHKREEIFASFRTMENRTSDMSAWPWLYGDAFGSVDDSIHINLITSSVRHQHLQNWINGNFIDDWDDESSNTTSLEDLPLAEQAHELTKSALDYCLADAFHPGCEMTWPMRHLSLYSEPFRIAHASPNSSEPDYGEALNPTHISLANGPYKAQRAGDITRWMGLPWQGDTVFCRSGYPGGLNAYLPSFWPARVPNQVLSEQAYQVVMNTSLPLPIRRNMFNNRSHWVRFIQSNASLPDQILQMVRDFALLGVVEARPGPSDTDEFPDVIYVETLPATVDTDQHHMNMAFEQLATLPAEAAEEPYWKKAGWLSEDQMKRFTRVKLKRDPDAIPTPPE